MLSLSRLHLSPAFPTVLSRPVTWQVLQFFVAVSRVGEKASVATASSGIDARYGGSSSIPWYASVGTGMPLPDWPSQMCADDRWDLQVLGWELEAHDR